MALNPRYVTAPSLQSYFVDKDSGFPLSGGRVYFYRDTNRTELKSVFELQGNQANYTYSPLPNPVILSAVGTIQDNNGNDVIPYYYPFDQFGDIDLYYIVVQNSLGVPQFTRQAWPNPDFSNSPASSDDNLNYIPNGQLLAHTNLPNNALVAGSNIIAQGGFTIELDNPALPGPSVNTLVFLTEQFTQAPPQSPRYLMQFTCSTFNASETTKSIRIKWTDVNKFSTKPGPYTFAFWGTSNVSLPVAINVVKFYGTGGSPIETIPQALATITAAVQPTLYQFEINFGLNSGKSVDLANQDDFVAIDISLPRNIAFVASFTDFVLANGDAQVLNFPVQTDADMMARGVFGWADKVDPTGMDLYLPPILTKRGMTWDSSQVGNVGMDILPIESPLALPAPEHNMMPCDGAIYISDDYASNGIPFRRLANVLISHPDDLNVLPLYGTGSNYISALIPFSGVANDTVRIVYNIAGAGSSLALNGANTNITFAPIYVYGGLTTGRATLGVFSSNMGLNTVSMIPMAGFNITAAADGTTGFTIAPISTSMALRAFQTISFSVITLPAAALAAGNGKYFTFTVSAQAYYMWFNVGGAQPAPAVPPPGIGIEVRVDVSYTAQDMADMIREALNAFNGTQLTMPVPVPGAGGGIQPGSHFLFSSNPGALRNFYVWFTVDENGIDPLVVGATGFRIDLLSTYTNTQIRDLIRGTLNQYQFQAPDFRGMFFRAADPNATWDLDAASRWSYTAGIDGPFAGTFEYQQFLNHNHFQSPFTLYINISAGSDVSSGGVVTQNGNVTTLNSGGSETRPVNTYIYPFIRY